MSKGQKKNSYKKRKIISEDLKNIIKRYSITILCGIYGILILIFGLIFMVFQDGFVIGESMKADKMRQNYLEYMESEQELWYGIELDFNKITQSTIVDLLAEIELFEKNLVYINMSTENEEQILAFPSTYSLSSLDDNSKFTMYDFDDRIGNNLLFLMSGEREISFSPDLEPISSKVSDLYMELIEDNFSHYRIKKLHRDGYWLREYDIKTNNTLDISEYENVYYITLEFMNENSTTEMYLIIKDELLGDVYEHFIAEKFSSGKSYLIEDAFLIETFNYRSGPEEKESSLPFYQSERDFLYSLISSNAVYMGDPMKFEGEEIRLNYLDCVFISAMYATTTGYADVIISNDILKILASIEAVVENGIILALIVGLLTSAVEKKMN